MSQRFLNGSTDFYSFLRMLETQAAALPDGNNYQTLLNHMYSDPLYAYVRSEEPGLTSEERSTRLSESISVLTEATAQTYAPDAVVDATARSLSDDIMLHAYDVSNGDVAWQDLPAGLEDRFETYTSEFQPAVEVLAPELGTAPEVEYHNNIIHGREVSPELVSLLSQASTGDRDAITDTIVMRGDIMNDVFPDMAALEAINLTYADILQAHEDGSIVLEDALALALPDLIADSTYVAANPYDDNQAPLDLTGGDSDASAYIADSVADGDIEAFEGTFLGTITFEVEPDPISAPELAPASDADTLPSVDTAPQLASAFTNAASNIADASVLLNGVAADDMDFLEDLVEEARGLGVDTELLTSISAEISANDFVTSQAAAEGVRAYAETLKAALENDDLITNDEYKGALTNLFTGIAGGMVVDRAGLVDDIAAAPGMEDQATRVMREALEAAANTAPEMATVRPQARPQTFEMS